jgi:hypothetical protein
MSFKMGLNQTLNLGMSMGVGTDYTYVSSAPPRFTIDASGVVTPLLPGISAITITRKSDGKTVDKVMIYVSGVSGGYGVGGYATRGYGS